MVSFGGWFRSYSYPCGGMTGAFHRYGYKSGVWLPWHMWVNGRYTAAYIGIKNIHEKWKMFHWWYNGSNCSHQSKRLSVFEFVWKKDSLYLHFVSDFLEFYGKFDNTLLKSYHFSVQNQFIGLDKNFELLCQSIQSLIYITFQNDQ